MSARWTNWFRPSDWLGRLLSLAFIGAAGAVALQMAWNSGADEIRRITMVAIVGAGLGVVAFGPGLTLGRGRFLAALCLLPVWLAAVGYNGLSALEYFDRYPADAAARAGVRQDLFQEQRNELERLRSRRAAIKTMRSGATIQADIDREKRSRCRANCLKLKAELAAAEDRDALDDQIRAVAAKLSGATAYGVADTSRHLKPVFRWLTTATGVTIASAKDLRALFLLLITEMGAALVPVAMALASRRRKPERQAENRTADPAPEAEPSGPSAPALPERPDVRRIVSWMSARTKAVSGGLVPASELYDDYCAWARTRGHKPVSRTRFGTVLSDDLGLAKRKAGAKWTVNYLDLELKHSGARPPANEPFLAIAGGQAA
jgi:hypothetical protein